MNHQTRLRRNHLKRLIPEILAHCPGYACGVGVGLELPRFAQRSRECIRGRLGVRRRVASLYRAAAMEALRNGGLDLAIALLVNGVRHEKRGQCRRRLMSLSNDFGMIRRSSFEEDSRSAFFGVQLSKYLARKRTRRIATPAEADMLTQLLWESWQQYRDEVLQADVSASELLEAFAGVPIVFPYVELPPDFRDPMIDVDFDRGERLSPERRCWCGSGLGHFRCHGRTPGAEELGIGKFWPKNS